MADPDDSRGRPKKYSQDFGKGKTIEPLQEQALQSSTLPSVVISRWVFLVTLSNLPTNNYFFSEPGDDDDILTSGQVSPVCM